MRILKVAGLPDTSQHPHDPRSVMVLVHQVFRGKTVPEPVQLDTISYKPDYILIPKDQEAKYLNATEKPEEKILPRTTEYPPLLKELLIRQAKQQKQEITDLKLEIKYNLSGIKNYRIAREGETPTVTVEMGLGKPASPSLYANIKRESVS